MYTYMFDSILITLLTLVCLINEHVRLFFLEKKSTLCALIRQYSIIMIRPCAFINFLIFFHPVRLLSPVRLLGRPGYCNWEKIYIGTLHADWLSGLIIIISKCKLQFKGPQIMRNFKLTFPTKIGNKFLSLHGCKSTAAPCCARSPATSLT